MKLKYIRVSSVGQSTGRQEVNKGEFDKILVDKVSGTIPFFERPMGKLIDEMILENLITEIHVHSIDRLGRNLKSTLETIEIFNNYSIPIVIEDLNLRTFDNGKITPSVELLINLQGAYFQFENQIRKERQMEGIKIARLKGKYKGRRKNTKEDTFSFLNKSKNKRALELMKSTDMSNREIANAVQLHYNTVGKVRKLC